MILHAASKNFGRWSACSILSRFILSLLLCKGIMSQVPHIAQRFLLKLGGKRSEYPLILR